MQLIINGFKDVIQPTTQYIIDNSKDEYIYLYAFSLIKCITKIEMTKKAALIASQFSKFFPPDINVQLITFSLVTILSEATSSCIVQLRDLCIPMLTNLLSQKQKVPMTILSSAISKILSYIGPSLTRKNQKILFDELTTSKCIKINLPITVCQMTFQTLPYTIIKDTGGKSENVFLYSYLPGKKKRESDITIPVGQSNSISFQVFNPFSVALNADSIQLCSNDKNVICHPCKRLFLPNSKTLIYCHFQPTKVSDFKFDAISLNLFGANQIIEIPSEMVFRSVDRVPHFILQTDLPISSNLSLYDGEVYEFTFWITNSGSTPITDLAVEFQQPETAVVTTPPTLPLLPNEKTEIKCKFTSDKGDEYMGVRITSSSEGSEYKCSQNIRQYLDNVDGLAIERIFLANPPVADLSDPSMSIRVGFEIRNLSHCSFQYKTNITEEVTEGLIGPHEPLLMIATYSLSDLQTNDIDANKSRIIAMTRQKEQKLGRSLSSKERIKVAKSVSIMQRLESKWFFEWAVSSRRVGMLVTRSTHVDEELFLRIESHQTRTNVTWLENGETVNSLHCNHIYELKIEFENESVNKCALEFVEDISVLWEGELQQTCESGKSIYIFVLCFGSIGRFKALVTNAVGNVERRSMFSVDVGE